MFGKLEKKKKKGDILRLLQILFHVFCKLIDVSIFEK